MPPISQPSKSTVRTPTATCRAARAARGDLSDGKVPQPLPLWPPRRPAELLPLLPLLCCWRQGPDEQLGRPSPLRTWNSCSRAAGSRRCCWSERLRCCCSDRCRSCMKAAAVAGSSNCQPLSVPGLAAGHGLAALSCGSCRGALAADAAGGQQPVPPLPPRSLPPLPGCPQWCSTGRAPYNPSATAAASSPGSRASGASNARSRLLAPPSSRPSREEVDRSEPSSQSTCWPGEPGSACPGCCRDCRIWASSRRTRQPLQAACSNRRKELFGRA